MSQTLDRSRNIRQRWRTEGVCCSYGRILIDDRKHRALVRRDRGALERDCPLKVPTKVVEISDHLASRHRPGTSTIMLGRTEKEEGTDGWHA
jgi:hypothetical protein